MIGSTTSEGAFKTVIECHLLASGYEAMNPAGFERKRAIFPQTTSALIREMQLKEWPRL